MDKAGGGAGIRAQIEAALPDLLQRWKPAAVGVGFGGPLERSTGRIALSHQIPGWSEFGLVEWLQGLARVPVWAENDANTAAWAEAEQGAGIGFDPVFYVTLGSGVGGGCVVNGQVYHGTAPGESEIGHLRLDRSGVIVEQRCSGWAVDARIRALQSQGSTGPLCQLLPVAHGGEAKYLAQAVESGDPEARRILEEIAEDLAFALSHVCHLFHPQVIVLGGGLSLVGNPFRAAVAQWLPHFLMDVFQPGPEVKLAALGEDAVPVGCLLGARTLQS